MKTPRGVGMTGLWAVVEEDHPNKNNGKTMSNYMGSVPGQKIL